MALSWNEIKDRAIKFSKEWENETSEDAEAKSFLDDFFEVFGISRRRVATFETRVKKIDGRDGYIDLLWKGEILIEQKSKGQDLSKAFKQATDYFPGIKEKDLPKYILVSDFQRFRLFDLEEGTQTEFLLKYFYKNVKLFGFIAGYQKKVYKAEDPVNIEAAELMGKLHDKLKSVGYKGHPLELYLVRLLFCLFADDTTIFEKDIFHDFIEQRTSEDGSDLAGRISELFYILNTPYDKRLKNLDEQLNAFPYVNGKLFEETLPPASFDSNMRSILLECCTLNWGKISPAIFGSMFQSVMNPIERRNLGAHYTSEKNILKLIKPLFLDELWSEFESIKGNKNKLVEFHKKLSSLKFFDPACGCGNFLVITYRELRILEIEILRSLNKSGTGVIDVREIIWLDVDMMFGIEYEEFPARIAEVAMWLIDHQMNMAISEEFGQYFVRLPLKKSASIIHGNALQLDWEKIVSPNQLSFILGNPPFLGKKEQNSEQKNDMEKVFSDIKGTGILDYVTAWYVKAARFIQGTKIKVAFVSTNSITQGEQVSVFWGILLKKYDIKIHFAHQTFKWTNEARGNAGVHVVIIGFANYDVNNKFIYEYENISGEPHEKKVNNINPYLVESRDVYIENRKSPICNTQEIVYGSFALDDGNYTLSEDDKNEILSTNSKSEKLIRPFIGGRELLHSEKRYCLWLVDAKPDDIKSNSKIKERVEAVKKWRANSDRENTKKLAFTPAIFAEIRQPKANYLAFPTVSSVNRKYIPIAFLSPEIIASNQLYVLPNATLYHFGILISFMHMVWVKYICGRLKSDYRYSASIVYNNFPWPENPNKGQIKNIEIAAQRVLDARAEFHNNSLAELYDPLLTPSNLAKAHQELDKAVDLCYRPQPFSTETKRIEFLFELYEKYTADLFTIEKPKKLKIKKEK